MAVPSKPQLPPTMFYLTLAITMIAIGVAICFCLTEIFSVFWSLDVEVKNAASYVKIVF
ncbi:MAG TPA: hypothetical protein VIR98_02800 [Candidatus Paceibacterota bacterium]